jgi:hypothetical protein
VRSASTATQGDTDPLDRGRLTKRRAGLDREPDTGRARTFVGGHVVGHRQRTRPPRLQPVDHPGRPTSSSRFRGEDMNKGSMNAVSSSARSITRTAASNGCCVGVAGVVMSSR